MRRLLHALFLRCIVVGRLRVRWPDGTRTCYGQPEPLGPGAASGSLALIDAGAVRALVRDPGLALGELYMDRRLIPDGCNLYDMLDVLLSNFAHGTATHPVMAARNSVARLLRRTAQFNPAARARRNVAHHYDLNGRLYSLFLDRDRQYSCAYFPTGTETLEQAQAAKKRHIAAKLKLDRPDLQVLDIGCGWGGTALTLAREHGARVTGITLSEEQLTECRARAVAEGLADRVRFELLDYRHVAARIPRPFDRIVSVGMFEHVGLGHYRTFFETVKRLLAPAGVALLHTIGRSDGPGRTNAWIAKYIFPGGYSPALSEMIAPIERSGLIITDVEVLRLHYAETLRHWRRRFAANRNAIAAIYDEQFCRMFEFYLCGSELTFRRQDHVNFQIQLTREQTALPRVRDYMFENERMAVPARQDA